MISHVELSTFNYDSFKLDFRRNERDPQGTYKLIRYQLPKDNETTWNAVANDWVQVYMSEHHHMTPNLYLGGIDIEYINTEKVVTDVSDILRFHDEIIDNKDLDTNRVYAYTLFVEEHSSKYRTPFVVGYIESELQKYSPTYQPTMVLDWLKHRGICDVEILNRQYANIHDDLAFEFDQQEVVTNKHDNLIDKIKVSELMDKLEQVVALNEMLQLHLPTKEVTTRLGWGVSEFGVDPWGFVQIILELGFPYNFS